MEYSDVLGMQTKARLYCCLYFLLFLELLTGFDASVQR